MCCKGSVNIVGSPGLSRKEHITIVKSLPLPQTLPGIGSGWLSYSDLSLIAVVALLPWCCQQEQINKRTTNVGNQIRHLALLVFSAHNRNDSFNAVWVIDCRFHPASFYYLTISTVDHHVLNIPRLFFISASLE